MTDVLLEPDPDTMRWHLDHLFGGDLDGLQDGLIELAWSDADTGDLCHAQLFPTDQLDQLVETALRHNCVAGQNVYLGQALRQPKAPLSGRCSDAQFLALTAFYADLDDNVVAQARDVYRTRGCPPTAVVVTGRQPHVRAQLLWRQETPERDPDCCREQNLVLAQALGGDRSVVNPGRVLRLAGSLAWPVKPGRVLERTELQTFSDGRPRVYLAGQLARAFPPAMRSDPTSSTAEGAAADDDLLLGGLSVAACLAKVRSGDRWHDHLVRLTGHWVSRGWSDTEILTLAESLTLAGYGVDQTRREVARMIEGARRKWRVPNPEPRLEDDRPLPPLEPRWVEDLHAAMLPRRRWLLGRTLLRAQLTLRVAPGGVGKSTLALEEAVAVATGRELTGEPVHESAPAWVYNNEDDSDEMRRRLAAILQCWDVPLGELRDRLAMNSGADRPLLVAKADRAGNIVRLPDVDGCIEHVQRHAIGLLVVDPFVETHEVSENANEQIKAVAAMFRDIARQGTCAVLLVHHTAKPPQGGSDGHAGNMNSARGASALTGVARVVQTLFGMSGKDAEACGVNEEDRHRYVRLDDAKANMGPPGMATRWFQCEGVQIANGDEVGVLVPTRLEAAADGASGEPQQAIIAALLQLVPEPELSLNAAARRLAWGGDQQFARYRETDDKGHQRVSKPLRTAILAACRRGVCVLLGDLSCGFTCNTQDRPITLRRFAQPASTADLADAPPEFMEEP